MLILALLASGSLLSDLRVERANEFTSSTQDAVVLAVDASGKSITAWHSRRQQGGTYGVYARGFDADGTPLTGEVQLNLTTRSHQRAPALALDEGGVWAAWTSFLQDGDQGAIVARRFDSRLEHGSPELIVNQDARGDQRELVLGSDARGRALVVWTSAPDDETPRGVFARRLDPNGTPAAASLRLDAADGAWSQRPSLAVAPDGSALVVWASTPDGATPDGILGRRLDSDGQLMGEVLRVSPARRGGAIEPVTTRAGETGFVTAWLELRGGEWAIAWRRLEFEGGELVEGPVIEVDAESGGYFAESGCYVSGLAIAGRAEGGFALAWNLISQDDERASDVVVQRFDADGQPFGEALAVTGDSRGDQRLSQADGRRKLFYAEDGSLIVAWSGDAQLGDPKGANVSWLTPEDQQLQATRNSPTDAPENGSRTDATGGDDFGGDDFGGDDPPRPAMAGDEDTPAPHDLPTHDPNHQPTPLPMQTVYFGTTGNFGFQGIANSGWDPPDPHMSVGPNHVVMVTNGAVAIYGKDGTPQFQDQLEDANGFWGNQGATGFVFDPETVYDPHAQRFIVMANERVTNGPPYFLLAVSDDSDPNGSWHKYRINVQPDINDTDIDSPNLAVDALAIYLTADFFGPDKYLVYVIDKSSVLSGGTLSANSTVLPNRQSLGVPVTHDANATRQYMIWSPESGNSTSLTLYAINNPLSAPSLQSFVLSVPAFTQPEDPPQAGTSVRPDTFESRFWSCVFRNGSLWATHHVNNQRVRQRWYQIDMASWPVSGTPSLVQWGEVDPGGSQRTYFGSIGVDARDNMALTFAQSSPNDLIEMRYAYRRAADAPGTTSATELAQASTSSSTSGRWGDYSTMVADPQDVGSFWGYHEYKLPGGWRTWAQHFTICAAPTTYCTTSPNSAGSGALIGYTGGASISANDLVLQVLAAAPNQSGLFYYGRSQVALPFGDGTRCVGGTLFRRPPVAADAFGDASFHLDYSAITSLPAQIFAGDTRHFQFWYRDPAFGGAGFNLSNGLTVQFCP